MDFAVLCLTRGNDDGFEEIEESVVGWGGVFKSGGDREVEELDEGGDGVVLDWGVFSNRAEADGRGLGGFRGIGEETVEGAVRAGELDDVGAVGARPCALGSIDGDALAGGGPLFLGDLEREAGACGDGLEAVLEGLQVAAAGEVGININSFLHVLSP